MADDRVLVGFLASPSPEVAAMIRRVLPDGWTLVTSDGPADAPAFREALKTMTYMISSATRFDAASIEAAPLLRVVHKLGVGYDDVDIDALAKRGLALAVSSTGTIEAVVEHTLAMMLAGLKALPKLDRRVRVDKTWPRWEMRQHVRQMSGSRVGLLGFGRIGQAVAKVVLSLGASVAVYGRTPPKDLPSILADAKASGRLRFVAAIQDIFEPDAIVSLHAPLTPATRGLVTEDLLARLGPNGIFINTSRGPMVDEEGLARVLNDGRLGFAALDVLCQEPPPPTLPLLDAPNLLITPHLAGGGMDVIERRVAFVIDNLKTFHATGELREKVALPLLPRDPT